MDVRLLLGDCLERMREIPGGSVDAVVTDPPAGIAFMGKEWDGHKGGRAEWVAWLAERMAEAYRIARPGSYALVWALPRTSHWTATAVEDAGWTIRDRVTHLFGTGFPKAKSCLKPGAEDWWLAYKPGGKMSPLQIDACRIGIDEIKGRKNGGFGPMCRDDNWEPPEYSAYEAHSGRWPANVVLSHSEGCRLVGTRRVKGDPRPGGEGSRPGGFGDVGSDSGDGRPAGKLYGDAEVESWECVEDCPVAMLDAMSGECPSSSGIRPRGIANKVYGRHRDTPFESYGDSGSASRFFYTSKASGADRGSYNDHATVKSTDLMRWLCRLITPPGGTILDPFMGSGSTGKAAQLEGFGFVGIERDPDYFAIAERRMRGLQRPLFAS